MRVPVSVTSRKAYRKSTFLTPPPPDENKHGAATKQELDATAVYHGLATKHPLVPKLARQMRKGSTANGNDLSRDLGDKGGQASASGRRSSGGGRRGSEVSKSSVDKGRRSSKVRMTIFRSAYLKHKHMYLKKKRKRDDDDVFVLFG